MNLKLNLILLLLALPFWCSQAQMNDPYLEFEDIDQSGISVTTLFQDDLGQLWVCTLDGMYIYDGNTVRRSKNRISSDLSSRFLRCYYKINSEEYYIGSENGIYLLNLRTDSFALIPQTAGIDVRIMAKLDETTFWLGTMDGVLKFNTETMRAEKVNEIASYPVVSIQYNKEKKTVYFSNDNGFYVYDLLSQTYTFVPLPAKGAKSYLVHAMTYDNIHNCLWVGAENVFFKYDIATGEFEKKKLSSDNTINVITVDISGYVWVGTDSGVCVYNPDTDRENTFQSTSQNIRGVVWAIFEGRKGTMWVGTDGGLSLYKKNPSVQIHRWEELCGSRERNRMTCMLKDSRGNYWFGGTNGLGRLAPGRKQIDWYKISGSGHYIIHNRIRCIYEDYEGDLWVGTNESINRFDYNKGFFTHYTIMDSTRTRNADWCQSIVGDEFGKLWISSFLGGVFCVDKKALISSNEKIFLAEENYYQHSGKFALSSDRVQAILCDRQGNLWISTNGYGLNKIDFRVDSTFLFTSGQPKRTLLKNDILSLFCDADGFVWVGMAGGLQRIDPQTHEVITVRGDILNAVDVFSITEKGGFLWFTTSDGLFALNKKTHELLQTKLGDERYVCSLLDNEQGRIFVGGNNHCISFDPEGVLNEMLRVQPVILTTLYVNDALVSAGEKYDGNQILEQSITYADHIVLKHNQNNLSILLTDSRYDQILKCEYKYKLENVDTNWAALDVMNNRITYTNLQPGKYNLIIRQTDTEDNAIAVRRLSIQVLSPWYGTILAKISYATLLLGLFVWVINYFRVRNNLKLERLKREKILELSAMKMEFLTNMSHELKTPLSLILSPLNKLMEGTKNTKNGKLVEMIHENTMQLCTLVNRIIDSEKMSDSQEDVLLSKLEVVEFSRSIFNIYKEAFEEKGIIMQFKTNIPQLYICVDILKLESILNNLFSNAGKFSEKEDVIILELKYDDTESNRHLKLTVSDTGIGIPPEDIPYVFDRFYQSEENLAKNKDGSGIGLAVVKKFVELHHGDIQVESEKGKGTSFIITLPVVDAIAVEPVASAFDACSVPGSVVKVLIVEDNVEIARFLTENLKDMVCTVVHNGRSGYQMAQDLQPDIIISDIMMPVMDGIEMSRLLKQNISTAAIPIIILTAKDDKQTETKAYGIGIDAFIAKPFDIRQLELRIQQIIRNKSLLIRKINQANIVQHKDIIIESSEEKLLMSITRIIEEKLSDSDLNVQKLSELSGINAKQIYRRIKQLTGHTTVDYIKSIRLKKAAFLLAQQKYTVSEVMYMVGFSNPSYFSKCFVEKYGKTPKQYMESAMNVAG